MRRGSFRVKLARTVNMGEKLLPAPELAEKQRQFNTAIEKYNNSRGYHMFDMLVASVNICLQAWLLWRSWHFSIGIGRQLAALMIAWVLADFVNGLVHMYMDNNDRYDSLAGPLIANFHLHHKTPLYKRKFLPMVYFVESGSKVWLAPVLAVTALLSLSAQINPFLFCILVYTGILSSVAEVSHYLCHTSRAPLAMLLGDCGILLAKRHHAGHHLQDNVNYAFLNGLTDPVLNLIARRFSRGYKQHTDLHYATWQADGESR